MVQCGHEPPAAPAAAPLQGRGWAPASGKLIRVQTPNSSFMSSPRKSECDPHLGTPQLQVGAVHIPAQQLVEGRVACQNNGLVSPLDAPATHTCSSQ